MKTSASALLHPLDRVQACPYLGEGGQGAIDLGAGGLDGLGRDDAALRPVYRFRRGCERRRPAPLAGPWPVSDSPYVAARGGAGGVLRELLIRGLLMSHTTDDRSQWRRRPRANDRALGGQVRRRRETPLMRLTVVSLRRGDQMRSATEFVTRELGKKPLSWQPRSTPSDGAFTDHAGGSRDSHPQAGVSSRRFRWRRQHGLEWSLVDHQNIIMPRSEPLQEQEIEMWLEEGLAFENIIPPCTEVEVPTEGI